MFFADLAVIDPEVQLPPSIHTLAFNGYNDLGLPPQLSSLTSVETLVFGGNGLNFEGMEACVSQMTRLTFLELEGTLFFPPCIGSLTSLQHLAVAVFNDAPDDDDLDGVAPALQRLTGLTSLLLTVDYPVQGSPPPALAGLSRLQRLCFLAQEGPLPLGPYSAGLRAAPSRQPAAPRAQGVEQLPDDLLTRILGGLSLRERQVAALVSRRWHRCAHAPELCRNLTVAIDEWQPRASDWRQEARAPNLASFAAWLQRHGQHLRCLQLEVLPYDGYDEQAVGQELARCMSAAMPQLDQLLITLHNNWLTVGWAGQLPPSLRELGVHLYGWDEKLRISASLGGLTHLTKLVLSASRLKLNAGVQLPPSLRTLALNGNSKRGLPQLAGLTRLETFAMGSFAYNVDGLSAFTAMKQLTFLDLSNLSWHPFIGSLTNLQHLAVLDHTCIVAALDFEQVNTALERLTQLTTLLLEADRSWEGRVPPALAGQSRLQRLYYAAVLLPTPGVF
ncbi:leucine-rich repeat receptor-like serine threonine- kinase BAM1 [Chlorella sorokiniana]|uniref:Leucine-rich repeat receptor-like serine threonine-kinase BAM1 n=1 Tax=Chlorella sorokiniana TaxID=3076 RepID=A0A2P6TCP6_CHLSO|nr:leucine-rich repeat receptor-like serine threonine- kinase BAM1 [Chlorella sorokiniana]|eukprot:PRW20407.1 leucine-rich repeat receptor-like serine threonine- kinase BAM1 [Chlorella sorokiniana]